MKLTDYRDLLFAPCVSASNG